MRIFCSFFSAGRRLSWGSHLASNIFPVFKPTAALRDLCRACAALVFGCLLAIGPLGLMQAVAWAGMAVSYSARSGLAEGLKQTFDGEHPCAMCKKIAAAKQSEESPAKPAAPAPVKLVCLPSAPADLPAAAVRLTEERYPLANAELPLRPARPPSPPPRA